MLNNLKITYQNLGSNWLIILTGKEEDINLQFNSFWNHKATNSRGLDWQDLVTATFWCKPSRNKRGLSLWNYFYNRRLHVLGDSFDESVKQRARQYTGKLSKEKYCARFTRLYVGMLANKEFRDFAENSKTDFNLSFTTSVQEYNECSSQGEREESFTPEVVSKCWEGI